MEYLPAWTKTGSWTLGRDPLGMQATSVRMYRNLVPGLTNVTNRLRYYSFYCWVVQLYEKTKHTSEDLEWRKFIRRAEALYALACYVVNPQESQGMGGGIWANDESRKLTTDSYDLTPYTDSPGQSGQYLKAPRGNFGQFYIASMVEVGLLTPTTGSIPIVSEDLGRKMANAFSETIGNVTDAIEEAILKGAISREGLIKIGRTAHPSNIEPHSNEMSQLRDYVLARNLNDGKKGDARRSSAWLALDLMSKGVSFNNDHDFRRAFYNRSLPDGTPYLAEGVIIDRWQAFQANEFCHISLEMLLNGLLSWQSRKYPDGLDPQKLILDFLSGFLPQTIDPFETQALSISREYIGREEELSSTILPALLDPAQSENKNALVAAVNLILTLWGRWSTPENKLRDIISYYAGENGKSLTGVLLTLDRHASKTLPEVLHELIRLHILTNHLAIAGYKLSNTGSFTYHFTLTDGVVADGRPSVYGFTNPRMGNLVRFLEDAGLCREGSVTTDGEKFLNDNKPI